MTLGSSGPDKKNAIDDAEKALPGPKSYAEILKSKKWIAEL